MKKSYVRRQRVSRLLLIAATVALIIRFTFRDHWAVFAIIYYACPLIVVAGFLLVAALCRWLNHRHVSAVTCLLLTVLLAVSWIRQSYQPADHAAAGAGTRLLFWNAARPRGDANAFIGVIRKQSPDIIGLVEAGTDNSASRKAFWRQQLPDYEVALPGGGMVCLVRGEIRDVRIYRIGRRSRITGFLARVGQEEIGVILVDFDSNPFASRRSLFADIRFRAGQFAGRPVVILGDFNTPHDSVWFDLLRESYRSARAEAGRGWQTTWPAVLPILAIDHIWVSRDVELIQTDDGASWHSDHRWLTVDIARTAVVSRLDRAAQDE